MRRVLFNHLPALLGFPQHAQYKYTMLGSNPRNEIRGLHFFGLIDHLERIRGLFLLIRFEVSVFFPLRDLRGIVGPFFAFCA